MARNKTYIDPLFYRPSEVKDFVDADPNSFGLAVVTPIDYTQYVIDIVDGSSDSAPSFILPVSSMNVISQVVKTQPDGSHVVDVVVEVPDAPGVTGYNIRITKI